MDPVFAEKLEKGLDTGQKATALVYLINMLIDSLIGISLLVVWGMINTVQFIVLYTDIKGVVFSWQLTIFLDKLRIIADADFVPYEWCTIIINWLFSENYIEFNTMDELMQIGSILFFGLIIILSASIVLIITSILRLPRYSAHQKKEGVDPPICSCAHW